MFESSRIFYIFALKFNYMKYIANIISKNKVSVSEFFNVTDDINSVDVTLPRRIVGWKEVKEIYPGQDILEGDISSNISWTFSKREKRYKYEKDINDFVNKTIKELESQINYRFFNFILSSESKREGFFKCVNDGGCSIYHNSRFLYIYSPNCKMTFGVSLQDLRYAGINVPEFIEALNINNNNTIIDNFNFITQESFPLIKDNIKSVPYLNYLKKSDIYKETED